MRLLIPPSIRDVGRDDARVMRQDHDLCEQIEHALRTPLPTLMVVTHLQPVEDPVSLDDQALDRPDASTPV